MDLETRTGICLPSQGIRERIIDGKIITPRSDFEARIQPSSFDPIIGDELWELDTDGLFRPQVNEEIYRTLKQIPGRQRKKRNINGGYEIKRGHNYLVPLEERIILGSCEFIKSSPKSSLGRLFLDTRLLADYNPAFDEISSQYRSDSELMLWLLLQPLARDLILHPGLALSQLRFHIGYGSQLTPTEVIEEFKKNPFLFFLNENGELVPAQYFITDAVLIHLDLSGRYTGGIIGLRARNNPTPIDLSKEGSYNAEDFFEPLKGNKISVSRLAEYYLLASKEFLVVPDDCNMELKRHSHVGFMGPLHFAGFLDNRFKGGVVFETRSDERSDIEFQDGMPFSKLDIFRTGIPDKFYGLGIGSHYQDQVGPRPPKYFKSFDFDFAARNYKRLDRVVLVQDNRILMRHGMKREGFEFITEEQVAALYRDIENGFFQNRYDCDYDDEVLQPIPYVILFGPNETVFSYVRSSDIKEYGDGRLFGKHSVGVGGHIIQKDGPRYVDRCLEREVMEEEVEVTGATTKPKLVGTLVVHEEEVDRFHFGLIFTVHTNGDVKPKEASIVSGRMINIYEPFGDSTYTRKYEPWSKVLIPYLPKLYKL